MEPNPNSHWGGAYGIHRETRKWDKLFRWALCLVERPCFRKRKVKSNEGSRLVLARASTCTHTWESIQCQHTDIYTCLLSHRHIKEDCWFLENHGKTGIHSSHLNGLHALFCDRRIKYAGWFRLYIDSYCRKRFRSPYVILLRNGGRGVGVIWFQTCG